MHRNPVALGLCADPLDYEWSSERVYRMPHAVAESWLKVPLTGLNLFADRDDSSHEQLVASYLRYTAWRMASKNVADDITAFDFRAGNAYWSANFSGMAEVPNTVTSREDLRDIALRVLAVRLPGLTFEDFLCQRCGAPFVAARREIIEQAIRANHKGVTIARFMKVTESTISNIRATLCPLSEDVRMGQL